MCETRTPFVPVEEAALLLETTEMRVLMMIKNHELQGRMEGGSWYVDRSSLQQCGKPKAAGIVKPGCSSGCGGGCNGH